MPGFYCHISILMFEWNNQQSFNFFIVHVILLASTYYYTPLLSLLLSSIDNNMKMFDKYPYSLCGRICIVYLATVLLEKLIACYCCYKYSRTSTIYQCYDSSYQKPGSGDKCQRMKYFWILVTLSHIFLSKKLKGKRMELISIQFARA